MIRIKFLCYTSPVCQTSWLGLSHRFTDFPEVVIEYCMIATSVQGGVISVPKLGEAHPASLEPGNNF